MLKRNIYNPGCNQPAGRSMFSPLKLNERYEFRWNCVVIMCACGWAFNVNWAGNIKRCRLCIQSFGRKPKDKVARFRYSQRLPPGMVFRLPSADPFQVPRLAAGEPPLPMTNFSIWPTILPVYLSIGIHFGFTLSRRNHVRSLKIAGHCPSSQIMQYR